MRRLKAIGPTFYAELVAYVGLVGNHFSWTPEGELFFFDGTPEAVRAGVEEIYADRDPAVRPPVTEFTPRELRSALRRMNSWQFGRRSLLTWKLGWFTTTSIAPNSFLCLRPSCRSRPGSLHR